MLSDIIESILTVILSIILLFAIFFVLIVTCPSFSEMILSIIKEAIG